MGAQFRAWVRHSRPEQRSLAWAFMEIKSTDLRLSQRFWDITKCTPLNVDRRFGGTYRLRIRDRRIRQARMMGFLGLLFDYEDEGDMILRNVNRLSMNNTAVLSRVSQLSYM
jgi:hypothetical protein